MQVRYRTAPTARTGPRLAAAAIRPSAFHGRPHEGSEWTLAGISSPMTESDHTRPSAATRSAEQEAAGVAHEADRAPTTDEARLAEQHRPDPRVAAHEKEMAERGKHQKGEGRI